MICHQASSAGESLSRHYYYIQDFLEKIDSGELDFSVDMEYYGFSDSATEIASYDENLKQLIEDIKNDMQYGVMDDLPAFRSHPGTAKCSMIPSPSMMDIMNQQRLIRPKAQTAFWMF